MRRSGKTTRAIDEAIQLIFSEGQILVPTKRNVDNLPNGVKICTDPDWHEGMAQRDFLNRLKRRIDVEQPNVYYKKEKDYVIFRALK